MINLSTPSGFFQGNGLSMLNGDSTYAEILPQNGLIPMINLGAGFAIEELPHSESLALNAVFAFETLKYDWLNTSCKPVAAWEPFYEALADLYIGEKTVDGQPMNPAMLSIDQTYADAVALDIYKRYEDSPNTKSAARNETEDESTEDTEDVQKKLVQTIQEFISVYIENDLLREDIGRIQASRPSRVNEDVDEYLAEWTAQAPVPEETSDIWLTIRLIEIYLPPVVFKSLGRKASYEHPQQTWREIVTHLERWTTLAAEGRSPFPIDRAHPAKLALKQSVIVVCHLADLIGRTILELETPERYFVRSLPAMAHLFNPLPFYLKINFHSSIPYPYPWLFLQKNDIQKIVFAEPGHLFSNEEIRSMQGISAISPHCHLYDEDVEQWLGADDTLRQIDTYALDTALQIWRFLRRLEQLWQHRDDLACPHCRMIVRKITETSQSAHHTPLKMQFLITLAQQLDYTPRGDNPLDRSLSAAIDQALARFPLRRPHFTLASMLDAQVFTILAFKPLLKAAQQYHRWLLREIDATYHRHPALSQPRMA